MTDGTSGGSASPPAPDRRMPRSIQCGMLVDTGAGALILPMAWKERFGEFQRSEPVELQLANQKVVRGEACKLDWPPGSGRFTIYPQSGKKRGEGNGVSQSRTIS